MLPIHRLMHQVFKTPNSVLSFITPLVANGFSLMGKKRCSHLLCGLGNRTLDSGDCGDVTAVCVTVE